MNCSVALLTALFLLQYSNVLPFLIAIYVYACICVCVCVYIYIYIYIYMVRLPRMDQFSIIDKNKGTHNKYCFKYFAMFSIRKPNFTNVSDRQLFGGGGGVQL
jgi:hypothetical protein